jgi:hypothetical protein
MLPITPPARRVSADWHADSSMTSATINNRFSLVPEIERLSIWFLQKPDLSRTILTGYLMVELGISPVF